MKIKVEIKNTILGDSIFWEGDSKDIDQIKNIPARNLASDVASDGETRYFGMWVVSEVKEEQCHESQEMKISLR